MDKKKINISEKLRLDNYDDGKYRKFLNPKKNCDLCNSSIAEDINKAYLEKSEKQPLKEFAKEWEDRFFRVTGRKLTHHKISQHFAFHMNAKGAAAQKFNELSQREIKETKLVPKKDYRKLENIPDSLQMVYDLLEDKYLNDIKVLNFTLKAQLDHLKEIKELKQERIEQNLGGVENLIMKEEEIVKNLQNIVLNKIKTFQAGKLQQAQTEAINSMNALNSQTMGMLGADTGIEIDPNMVKKSQFMFVSTVIKHVLNRLHDSLKAVSMSSDDKAIFFSQLKRDLRGVEQVIFDEFSKELKDLEMNSANE